MTKHGRFLVPLCAVWGMAIAGCSAAGDGPNPSQPTPDSGKNVVPVTDGRVVLTPRVALVNAALGVGDVRICLHKTDAAAEPKSTLVPLTNYAGLTAGGAAMLPSESLVNTTLDGFAVDANVLAQFENGKDPLPCSTASLLAKKYSIAPVAITGAPIVLALVGCGPNTGDAERCGADFDPMNGNLRFVIGALPSESTLKPGELGMQFLNLSRSLAAKGQVTAHAGTLATCDALDLGKPDVGVIGEPHALAVPSKFDSEGVTLCTTTNGRNDPLFSSSWTSMQVAGDPRAVPSEHYQPFTGVVVAAVGDANQASGKEALHMLTIRFDATK